MNQIRGLQKIALNEKRSTEELLKERIPKLQKEMPEEWKNRILDMKCYFYGLTYEKLGGRKGRKIRNTERGYSLFFIFYKGWFFM